MSQQRKYILKNNVLTLNPDFETSRHASGNSKQKTSSSAVAAPVVPLAIISSQNDLFMIQNIQTENGIIIEEDLPSSTVETIRYMQTTEYNTYFSVPSDRNLFDELCTYFIRYEVPIGLLTKLLVLRNYRLNFMVDDSGSMSSETDVRYKDATEFIRQGRKLDRFITRWQEAENRLHIMIDILAYIPAKHIQICFMNNVNTILLLSHEGKTPEMFQQEYHQLLSTTFRILKLGGTPTLATLRRGFQEAEYFDDPTSHYLLTDGVPTDASIDTVSKFIHNRKNPERNPLTLISCTNVDSECEWMKEIEEIAPFTAEIDDYNSERKEVMTDQGSAFPYTRGLWLLSNLIAALNPDDLDAMDESVPFSKHTLDEMLGRYHTPEEYHYYFKHNPHSNRFQEHFEELATVPQPARKIIPAHKLPKPIARSRSKNESYLFVFVVVFLFVVWCLFSKR